MVNIKKKNEKNNVNIDANVGVNKILVNDLESLDKLIEKVKKAQSIYQTFSQEKVDYIFKQASIAAAKARIPLAKLACEDTGMGVMEDKVIKNHFASEYIYNKHNLGVI